MGCSKQEDKSGKITELYLALNAWRIGRKRFSLRPEEILILLPRCLQNSDCAQNIVKDIANCKKCGKCKVKEIVEIAEEFGVKVFMAGGGRIALKKVMDSGVKGVVAVACEKELQDGLKASPKPVIAVPNIRPNGPCYETTVEPDKIRQAILKLTAASRAA